MPVRVHCPECGARWDIPDECAGQNGRSKCGQLVSVSPSRAMMVLQVVETGATTSDPDDAQVSEALRSLSEGEAAILTRETGRAEAAFIQVLRESDGMCQFEYNAGEVPFAQYEAVPRPSLDQVTPAFQRFARDDSAWLSDFRWRRMEWLT